MMHPRSFSHQDAAAVVAGVQMNTSDDWQANLARAEELITQAAEAGAELVALPEFFPLISGDRQLKLDLAEEEGKGPLQEALAALAARLGIWLVAGSLPLKSYVADKTTNTCLVYGPDGRQVVRYDKIHLFGFQKDGESYNESETLVPGNQPVTFDTPFGRVGLAICYDLRFPELFRALDEVDLLVIPAAFTVPTGQAHWELLLRARAVENQCYVLAPAQVGQHADGRKTWGHTLLIDPWGEVVSCLPQGEGSVLGELNSQRLQEIRTQLPALSNRRL
ncbi:carbon-nitrogen hydrolase family protein [Marinospirillum perlucidum]|uniref:carbon-nitrogen hydrolase family protein n=1 Tax=Marinospirillum perlucidum TaxID=1982602 RepID=UPI001C49B421|nr:carbon-nitrogen hydrolase family protein [Marinospirillum perlucidum]